VTKQGFRGRCKAINPLHLVTIFHDAQGAFKERVSNKKSQRSNFEGKSGFLVAGSCEATSEDEI
jgi:hypothetical protein